MPRDSKYHQGFFHPKNPQKYVGDVNNIVYRSSWELKFIQWCDRNDNILNYGSEEIRIKYYDPVKQKVRTYFPDFIIKVKEHSGEIKKYIIEIKPKKQTMPPKPGKRKTKSYLHEVYTYATNEAKWKAASEFCKDNMIGFKIITEEELGIK
jgi:hypothetical protein